MGAVSDESLLAAMAGGDQDAAAAFVRRHQARVYGLALTIVRLPALAEDVAQDTFVKAWRHAATYDPRRGRASTWLLTITRNAAIDAIRYRHDDPMDPDLLVALLTVRDESEESDDLDTDLALRQALAELPHEMAAPIVLMTYFGLTAQEIATREDVPAGTVKTRVRRGLERLRQRMGVRDA
ncbi:RNA polymerase sigma factor [Nocardioides sp. NPDC057577]|uniref:RNA polymerase sigma factor n=1 Tax=Nocardioides sp. NPDC057577 TaxID=3346171 RepID=UPI00366F6C9B